MEINKIETNKIIDKINETDVEKINEIYKIRLTKKKKRRLKQIKSDMKDDKFQLITQKYKKKS